MKKLLQFLFVCIFEISVCYSQSSFTGKPQYNILTIQNGDTIGVTAIELFPNIAPLHVANFDSLVNLHFYDSTAFHRVIPGFMIQGGDPNSRSGPDSTWGMGDPSQPTVNAEFSAAKHIRGAFSAARDNDTNSANSQFFICVATASWLNGIHTVYGRVISGMNFVDSIVNVPKDANDMPLEKIEMFITPAGSNDSIPAAPVLISPLSGSYSTNTSRALKWNSQSDGIIYTVEVATDSLFTNIVKAGTAGINQYNITGLNELTKYFWRVKTNNGGHFSDYSEVWSFYVSVVGFDEKVYNSNGISVFPNPGKDIFVFENIEKGSTLEIISPDGKLVLKVVADNNKVSINLNGQAKGVYFYTSISVDGKVTYGKLVVR